jgi:hypothetical protein
MVLAYVSVSQCSFIALNFGDTASFYDPLVLGLFNMAISDEDGNIYGCVPQNGDERFKDGAFGAGRTFGVLTATLTTFIFLLGGWIVFVMRPDWAEQAWRCLQGLIVTALFCQLTTFAVFGSSACTSVDVESFGSTVTVGTDCNPGVASAFGAVNVILLLILAFWACVVPAPVHPYFIRWVDDDDADGCESHDDEGSFLDGDDRDYPSKNDSTDDELYDDEDDDKLDGRSTDLGSEPKGASPRKSNGKGRRKVTDSREFT